MKEKILSVTMADCDMSTFSVGGAGGQRRDHTNTGVMIKHRASGAVGRGTSSRSQLQNKREAFSNMAESVKFKFWMSQQLVGYKKSPEEIVAEDMQEQNLRVEFGPF